MNLNLLEDEAKSAEEAGFTAAAEAIRVKIVLAKKLMIAREHYKYVKEEDVAAYAEKLKKATRRPKTAEDAALMKNRSAIGYANFIEDKLMLRALDKYEALPPRAALDAVKDAQARACFDSFVVASVEPVASKVKLPDPIVFGRITGCTDYFFVCEWGDDVKLADIVGGKEK